MEVCLIQFIWKVPPALLYEKENNQNHNVFGQAHWIFLMSSYCIVWLKMEDPILRPHSDGLELPTRT